MPDLGSVSAAIATIRTSIDIAKVIKDSNNSLDEAERKLKIADLISSLADVKIELAEVQDLLRDKDSEIRDLKEKINEKESLSFDGKFWWKEGDETPFCPICYESDKKLIHLEFNEYAPPKTSSMVSFSADEEHHRCRICNNKYY